MKNENEKTSARDAKLNSFKEIGRLLPRRTTILIIIEGPLRGLFARGRCIDAGEAR